MHITLTGNLGSGKSTICKLLEQQYGYEIFSTGKVIRQIADDLDISVLEMNELMSRDHKYDHMIDDKTAQISRENPDKNILFDSRLAWHFVEKSFKVFLSVDLAEAARRVYADASRGEVESYKSEADAAEQLAARAANEDARSPDEGGGVPRCGRAGEASADACFPETARVCSHGKFFPCRRSGSRQRDCPKRAGCGELRKRCARCCHRESRRQQDDRGERCGYCAACSRRGLRLCGGAACKGLTKELTKK